MKKEKFHACCSCRRGEIDYRESDVEMCVVRDPDTKKIVLRGYLCRDHQVMYCDDGYEVK